MAPLIDLGIIAATERWVNLSCGCQAGRYESGRSYRIAASHCPDHGPQPRRVAMLSVDGGPWA